MSRGRLLTLGLFIGLAVFVVPQSGCSSGPQPPSMAKVSGKIVRKGKPMPPVTVGFTALSGGIPAEYRYASVKTDAEGNYAIDPLPESEYLVSIVEEVTVPEPGAGGKVVASVGSPELLKYAHNSPLRTTVKAPGVEFNYDIPE
jgi:hypothetical protein